VVVSDLPAVGPPEEGLVYRIARNFDVFTPPDWSWAREDGTFGNRFDDPSAEDEIPEEDRFRVIYCSSRPVGAFGETISRYRKDVRLYAELKTIEDDEPLDPELEGGVVPEDWRLERRKASTHLDSSLLFADFTDPRSLVVLRRELASLLMHLGLEDFDLSSMTGPQRRLTQGAARYVYELTDFSSQPIFAGIRYLSRLNYHWELWALFDDRMLHTPAETFGTIRRNDPDLQEAASFFEIEIE